MRQFLVALLFVWSSSAFALEPVQLTWDGVGAPPEYCFNQGYGIPTYTAFFTHTGPNKAFVTWYCYKPTTGVYLGPYYSNPTCPNQYLIDVSNSICMPTNSGLDALLNMSVADAQTLLAAILLAFAMAWAVRVVARSLGSYRDPDD